MSGGLRDQLAAVYTEHGRLTPRLLVDTARPDDHPLHNRFEWDNRVAGEKYRRVQAAELIRSVRVEYVSATVEPVRTFHSVTRADGTTYAPVEEIAADEVATATLLRQMRRDVAALQRRYGHMEEFIRLLRDKVA